MNLGHNIEKSNEYRFMNTINKLPLETLPFEPLPSPRTNISPIGQKPFEKQLPQEKYLHAMLNYIASKNTSFFTNKLTPNNFRFVYSKDIDKTANVDLTNLTITVSPKFFKSLENSKQGFAILCHELSHIIRGHQEFNQAPQVVLNNIKYIRQNKILQNATKDLQLGNAAEVFRKFDTAFADIKKYYSIKNPGEFEYLLESRKALSGSDLRVFDTKLKNKMETFAKSEASDLGRNYISALENERTYYKNLQKWKDVSKKLSEIVDEILGEKNASLNWKEAEADILGFRMFIRAGFEPEDFSKILARTLKDKDDNLLNYLKEIKNIKNFHDFKFPERGDKSHPSPKWRIANLEIRELKLRYPNKYKKLIDDSKKNLRDEIIREFDAGLKNLLEM